MVSRGYRPRDYITTKNLKLTPIAVIAGLALLVTGCSSVKSPSRIAPPALSLAAAPERRPVRAIVVDAGHGGHDPGTMHHGLKEKDMTLDISRRLRGQLQAAGFSVTMTRDSDDFIPLSRRPAVATRTGADLFVSVHVNANRNKHIAGVEVYYPRESVVDAEASFPPRIGPDDVALPTTTVRRILWDLVLSRTRRQSAKLGLQICRTMRARLGARCRGVRGARFVVLKASRVPSVLVEVGYLSNRPEATRLATPEYRQAIAQSITEGIVAYTRSLGYEH